MYLCVTALEYVPSIISSTHSSIHGRVAVFTYVFVCVATAVVVYMYRASAVVLIVKLMEE